MRFCQSETLIKIVNHCKIECLCVSGLTCGILYYDFGFLVEAAKGNATLVVVKLGVL